MLPFNLRVVKQALLTALALKFSQPSRFFSKLESRVTVKIISKKLTLLSPDCQKNFITSNKARPRGLRNQEQKNCT